MGDITAGPLLMPFNSQNYLFVYSPAVSSESLERLCNFTERESQVRSLEVTLYLFHCLHERFRAKNIQWL